MGEVADLWITVRGITAPLSESLLKAGLDADRLTVQLKRMDEQATRAAVRLTAVGAEARAAGAGLGVAAAEARAAGTAMESSAAQTGLMGSKLLGLGPVIEKVAKWGTLGLVGVGVVATDMAMHFETAMVRLRTSAGETGDVIDGHLTGNLALVSEGVKKVAVDTGTSVEQLSAAMYRIESAGFHGAEGLKILKAAAEGARAEGADLDTVANTLDSTMNAFGFSTDHVNSVMNAMVATVANGKANMQELSAALSTVSPVASAAGLSLQEMLGSVAQMTSEGVTARQATQNLSFTIRSLQAPSNVARIAMASIGVDATDLAQHLGERGLTGSFGILNKAITDHMGKDGLIVVDTMNKSKAAAQSAQVMLAAMPPTVRSLAQAYLEGTTSLGAYKKAVKDLPSDQANLALQFKSTADMANGFDRAVANGTGPFKTYADVMKRAAGGAVGLNTALQLTGIHADAWADKVHKIGTAAEDDSKHVEGFAQVQQTLAYKLSRVKEVAETTAITFGQVLLPHVITALDGIVAAGKPVVAGLIAGWDLYGPAVKAKVGAAAKGIIHIAEDTFAPLKGPLIHGAVHGIDLLVASYRSLEKVARSSAKFVDPLKDALHDLTTSVASNAGAVGVAVDRVKAGVGLLGNAGAVLGPLASAVGLVAHAFSDLPGAVQLSVLAMIALRPFRPQIQAMQDSVIGFGRSAVSSFNGIRGAIETQQMMAARAGVEMGRFGASFAAIEARVPVIGAMGASFRTTSGSIQEAGGSLVGFRSNIGGVASALGTGARAGLVGALRGVYTLLGGGFGIVLAGAMIGLDHLAKKHAEAAAATQAHQARISSLTDALQQSNGVINQSVRAVAVQTLADLKLKDTKTGLLDIMHKAGVTTSEVTDAYLGMGAGADTVTAKLRALANQHTETFADASGSVSEVMTQEGKQFLEAADSIGKYAGEMPAAVARQKDLAAAVAGTGAAAADANSPTGRLKGVIATLASSTADADAKTRALHQALTLLNGGEIEVQAAAAQANAAIIDLNATWKESIDQSKGFGTALLTTSGALNTTTENGQSLFNKLQTLTAQTVTAAESAYDFARANGVGVAEALKTAEGAMQSSWDAAVTTGEKFGLTADQANNLAAQMGLIPSNLAITLAVKDLNPTQQAMLYVQGLADHLKEGASIKVNALTDEAKAALTAVGVKVTTLPNKQVEITVPTAEVMAQINQIIAKGIPDKSFTIRYYTIGDGTYSGSSAGRFADGGIVPRFADGGVLHAADGMTVPGYAPRRDSVLAMLSPGEGVLVPEAVRAIGGAASINAINRSARNGTRSMAASTPSLAARTLAKSGPANPATTPNLTVIVHGSVLSERELGDIVEERMLRIGMRSTQSYAPYRR
ncbi:phage tail tape measure protein [Kitasatospora sp. CMC57]|uniref:phage tail tape measure protein n=1 Tax=Kitasatospora sp. CMC57 TaxID=3231513 RepID=UPI0038B56412